MELNLKVMSRLQLLGVGGSTPLVVVVSVVLVLVLLLGGGVDTSAIKSVDKW